MENLAGERDEEKNSATRQALVDGIAAVPFSHQAVLDGHWEFYHDDDCGAVLDPVTKRCSACGWVPDMQSMGARRITRRNQLVKDIQQLLGGAELRNDEGEALIKEVRIRIRSQKGCADDS